jgi:hypothetical protein
MSGTLQIAEGLYKKFIATPGKRLETTLAWVPRTSLGRAILRVELQYMIPGKLSIDINHKTCKVVIEQLDASA